MAIKTNLIAWWQLEEASGTRNDSHSTNHLADNNAVTRAAGINSYGSFHVAASLQYLSIADNVALSWGDIDASVCGWVKFTTKTATMIMLGKWNAAVNHREYNIGYNFGADRFQFAVSNDGTTQKIVNADNLGSPSAGVWYFLYGYHDSVNNVVGISVNNGTANTAAHTTGVLDSDSPFEIGRISSGGYMDGVIDNVAVFKKLLTANELLTLYNGGVSLPYSALDYTALKNPATVPCLFAG